MTAVLVVCVAIGAAAHCVLRQSSVGFIDEVLYADVAHSIACDGAWVKYCPLSDQQLPSLYSLVISPAFLYGHGAGMQVIHHYMLWINFGAALVTAWLGFMLLRRYGNALGWCGAVAALVWPSCAVYRHTILSENVFVPVLLAAVWIMQSMLGRRQGAWRSALVGALFGVMYGIRPISTIVAFVPALVVMWRHAGWRAAMAFAGSTIVVSTAMMVPELLFGAGKLFIYAGREYECLGSMAAIMQHEGWLVLFVKRVVYHAIYFAAVALVVPVVAGWRVYHVMPKAWRVLWLCAHVCCLVMALGSAVHTFSEAPEKIDFIGRYMDPFITVIVLLSLPAVAQLRSHSLVLTVMVCVAVWCMLAWLPLRCEWWMQTLPVTYLRSLRFIHPRLSWCAWVCGLCLMLVMLACVKRTPAVSLSLAMLVALTINYLNVYEYRRYGAMLQALGERAQAILTEHAGLSAEEIALRIKSEQDDAGTVATLVRMMLYYDQLGHDDVRE